MACCRCERPWRRATKLALPVEGHGTGAWHSINCRSQSCFDDARRCDGAGRRPQDHRLPKRRWLHARARMAPSPAAMPAPMRTHLQLPLRGLLPLTDARRSSCRVASAQPFEPMCNVEPAVLRAATYGTDWSDTCRTGPRSCATASSITFSSLYKRLYTRALKSGIHSYDRRPHRHHDLV